MNFLELTQHRHSCRAYSDQPVEQAKLDYVMECVRLAPSAVNKQPWRFVIVDDESGRQALQRCYDREWFTTAPLYVLAVARHDQEWVRADGKAHGNIDVAIAVEHLCLAAAEQGLGTCWVCNFDAAMCRELLRLPATDEPVAIVPIGYPASSEVPAKKRKPLAEVFERRAE